MARSRADAETADDVDPVHLVEVPDGSADRRLAVAEVRAEPDVRAHAPTVAVTCGGRARNTALIRIPRSSHETPRAWGLLPVLLSTSMRRIALAIGFLGLALAATAGCCSRRTGDRSRDARPAHPGRRRTEAVALDARRRQRVDAVLRLWRLEPASRRGRCQRCARTTRSSSRRRSGRTRSRRRRTRRRQTRSQPEEWWLSQIGIYGLTPPGPGVPVTIVDSGLDVGHPEFLGRPDTIALNPQEPAPLGGEHGTMVASRHRGADERRRDRRDLPARHPPLVGHRQGRRHAARLERDRRAASSPRRAPDGRHQPQPRLRRERPLDRASPSARRSRPARSSSPPRATTATAAAPLGYPAAYPHVTTVAATDSRGAVAVFSSRSHYVDLAAPGARHRRRERARQRLAPGVRDELLVTDRRRRGRLGLDGPTRPERRAGRRDPPSLGHGHRTGGPRLLVGLRNAQRGCRARPPHAGPAIRSSRTTTSTRSTRTPTTTSPSSPLSRRRRSARRVSPGGSTATRTRTTCTASGSLPARASRRRSRRRPTVTSRSTRPPQGPWSGGSRRMAGSSSRRRRGPMSASCSRTRARAVGGTSS